MSNGKKDAAATALQKAKVKVSGVKPAAIRRTRWTLPVTGTPTADARSVRLGGGLRFTRGKRRVTFTGLRLTLGKKPAISGKVGKKRVTILTLSGAPKRNAGAGTIRLQRGRTTLSTAAVRVLRKDLKTSRVKAGRLGTTTVAVRTAATPAPVKPAPPAPAPPVTTPPAPPVVVPPAPQPPALEPICWAPTPTDRTDWIGCGTQTGGNLRSWITYLGTGGSVSVSDGATPLSTFDSRLTPGTWEPVPGAPGRVANVHTGTFRYQFPSHGNLDVELRNLTLVLSADRTSADVVVDATYNSFSDPEPVVALRATAMTLDLTAARSRASVGGATTFVLAPAFLTATGRTIWSDFYVVGARFGGFTFTVPDSTG